MKNTVLAHTVAVCAWLIAPGTAAAQPDPYFEIQVVDAADAPAPCVTLRTTNNIRFVSDENGRVAFCEPGLMNTRVYFGVEGEGVLGPDAGFGFRGVRFDTTPGGTGTVAVTLDDPPDCAPGDLHSRRLARGVLPPAGFMHLDVVDAETGRGVPLGELAMAGRRWWTDSAGVIAIDPLDLEGAQDATLRSHGYRFDGSVRVDVVAGGRARVMAQRENVAERLYRVTGGGIYRDSVLLGLPTPLARPLLNGGVLGQDTVFSAVFRGELFFLWGDTIGAGQPLGNFHTSSATAALPGDGGLDPSEGIDLTYFVDPESGFSRAMAPPDRVPTGAPEGSPGVTWLSTLIAVPDADGVERLHATFGTFGAGFERYRYGMLAYDEETDEFVEAAEYTRDDAHYPREGAYIWAHGDERYVYTHEPIRMPARSEALIDESTYEAFTPLVDGEVMRDAEGAAVYAWRRAAPRVVEADAAVADEERLFGHLIDVASGEAINAHGNGSTEINEHSGRFLRLSTPGGLGRLGETWFALADTPMGPWVAAQQIITHDRYTFYNPRHHRPLDDDFGRRVYFDATYTRAFSAADEATPRYDYNQVMYRLDLDAPALAVPVPIYRSERGALGDHAVLQPGDAPLIAEFLAPVRPRPGTVPVAWSGPDCEARRLIVGEDPPTPAIFYALPPEHEPGPHQQLLYEVEDADGIRYAVEETPGARVVAVVWRNPIKVRLPVADYLPIFRADAGPDRCVAPGPLELPAGDWRLDGAPFTPGASVEAGLHVVERTETRADGFSRQDTFLLRVGEAPELPPPPPAPPASGDEGCGCQLGGGSGGEAMFAVLIVALGVTRRRGSPGTGCDHG